MGQSFDYTGAAEDDYVPGQFYTVTLMALEVTNVMVCWNGMPFTSRHSYQRFEMKVNIRTMGTLKGGGCRAAALRPQNPKDRNLKSTYFFVDIMISKVLRISSSDEISH
jgi:hypothetical protein